jgi:hypothetical protein
MQSSARTSTMISGTFSLDLNPPIYNEDMHQHQVMGANQSLKRKVLARISVPLNPEACHRAFLVLMPHMSQIRSWANGVHRGSLFYFNKDGIHHEGDGVEPRYLQHGTSLSISLVQIPLLPHTLIPVLIHVQCRRCVDVYGLSLGAAVVRSTTAQCRSRLSIHFRGESEALTKGLTYGRTQQVGGPCKAVMHTTYPQTGGTLWPRCISSEHDAHHAVLQALGSCWPRYNNNQCFSCAPTESILHKSLFSSLHSYLTPLHPSRTAST